MNTVNEENAQTSVKSKRSPFRTVTDILALAVCIITAFLIWLSVSEDATSTLEKNFTVPITVENNSSYVLLTTNEENVEITVSGRPSVIEDLDENDFNFYVVIPSDAKTGSERYDIENSALPSGVTLESKARQTISLTLAEMVTREFTVKCRLEGEKIFEPYSIDYDGIALDYSTVKVTGPESTVDRITEAVVIIEDIGNVTTSFTAGGSVRFYDENGSEISRNISSDVKTVTASVTVYKVAEIPVTVSFTHGYFTSENCDIKASPSSITVKGSVSDIENISFGYVIDETGLEDGKNTITYDVVLPEGVENIDGTDKIQVTVDTVGISTRKILISGDSVIIKNPDSLSHSDISSITVTIRGDSDYVNTITSSSITATVDMAGLSVGTKTVNVDVSVSDDFSAYVYVVGTYQTMFKIIT